jgi:thioredoxin-like negative regulator of GroEL
MTTLILASTLCTAVLAVGAENYTDAHRETSETGKPMVVMVGADWCGPCQNLKNNILPEVRRHGLLARVAFAVVNVDREPHLTQPLTDGGPIPQLVMYRKTGDGWKRRKLVGARSVSEVEQFINEGLALDAESKQVTAGGDTAVSKTADADGRLPVHPISSH